MMMMNEEFQPDVIAEMDQELGKIDFGDEAEAKPPKKKWAFLFFQFSVSILIAAGFIVMNTFCPSIYHSIDRYLKEIFVVTIDFEQESKKVTDVFNELWVEYGPDFTPSTTKLDATAKLYSNAEERT